jgi:hypothetical protein
VCEINRILLLKSTTQFSVCRYGYNCLTDVTFTVLDTTKNIAVSWRLKIRFRHVSIYRSITRYEWVLNLPVTNNCDHRSQYLLVSAVLYYYLPKPLSDTTHSYPSVGTESESFSLNIKCRNFLQLGSEFHCSDQFELKTLSLLCL